MLFPADLVKKKILYNSNEDSLNKHTDGVPVKYQLRINGLFSDSSSLASCLAHCA